MGMVPEQALMCFHYSSSLVTALVHFGAPTLLRSTFNFLKSSEYVSSRPRDSRSRSGVSSCICVSVSVVCGSTAGVRPDVMSSYFFRRSRTGLVCSAVAKAPHWLQTKLFLIGSKAAPVRSSKPVTKTHRFWSSRSLATWRMFLRMPANLMERSVTAASITKGGMRFAHLA